MSKELIETMLNNRASEIASILDKGKDVELRTSKDGITVIEVNKKVVK